MRKIIKSLIAIVLVAAIVAVTYMFDIRNLVGNVQVFVQSFGAFGPIVMMLMMAIGVLIIPIPTSALAVTSGLLFGPWLGTLYAVIGAEIGAIIAFVLGRYLGKEWVIKLIHRDIDFCKVCTDKYLGVILFLIRLMPFAHFGVVSYGAGLAPISLRNFAIATLLGMIPVTFLEASIGANIGINATGIALTVLFIFLIVAIPLIIHKWNPLNLKRFFMHDDH